jgi:hypothetical protein
VTRELLILDSEMINHSKHDPLKFLLSDTVKHVHTVRTHRRAVLFALLMILTVGTLQAQTLTIASSPTLSPSVRLQHQSPQGGLIELVHHDGTLASNPAPVVETVRADDATLRLQTFPDGRFLLVSDVAVLTSGHLLRSGSRDQAVASGSPSGEAPAFIASNRAGSTVVAANPRIASSQSDRIGSRLVRVDPWNGIARLIELESASDRWIKTADVSPSGMLIGVIMSEDADQDGSQDIAVVLDRHGNRLGEFSTGAMLKGMSFSDDERFVTVYSSSRMTAFDLVDSRRVAGASMPGNALHAQYSAQKGVLIALGEDQITWVDVAARKILKADLPAGFPSDAVADRILASQSWVRDPGPTRFPLEAEIKPRFRKAESGGFILSGVPGRELSVTVRP